MNFDTNKTVGGYDILYYSKYEEKQADVIRMSSLGIVQNNNGKFPITWDNNGRAYYNGSPCTNTDYNLKKIPVEKWLPTSEMKSGMKFKNCRAIRFPFKNIGGGIISHLADKPELLVILLNGETLSFLSLYSGFEFLVEVEE